MSYKITVDRFISTDSLKSVIQQLKDGNIVAFHERDICYMSSVDTTIHITITACGYMRPEIKYVRLTNRQRRTLLKKTIDCVVGERIIIEAAGDEIEYIESLPDAYLV
jgi:hypothetical protein